MDVRSNFRKINVKSPHFPDIAKPSQDVFCGSGVSRDIPTSSFHQLLPCKPSRPSLYSAGHFFYLRVQTYPVFNNPQKIPLKIINLERTSFQLLSFLEFPASNDEFFVAARCGADAQSLVNAHQRGLSPSALAQVNGPTIAALHARGDALLHRQGGAQR